jgi:hypothetical protein
MGYRVQKVYEYKPHTIRPAGVLLVGLARRERVTYITAEAADARYPVHQMDGLAAATRPRRAEHGRGTMGLLMSDTTLIDPTLDDTTWLHESLRDWTYDQDAARDAAEHEAAHSTR